MQRIGIVTLTLVFLSVCMAYAAPELNKSASTNKASASEKKIDDLKKRFQKGLEHLAKHEYKAAREIFDQNIAEDSKAAGSILYAGIASNELYEPKKALEYFEKFKALDSTDERLLLGMLRAHQSLNETKEVEDLIKKIHTAKKTGAGRYLPLMESFERERIQQPDGKAIIITETFECKPTLAVWKYLLIDADMKPVKLVELVEATEAASAKARAADPKMGNQSAYMIQETNFKNSSDYKIYKSLIGIPKYENARTLALDIFAGKLKPLFESQPEEKK